MKKKNSFLAAATVDEAFIRIQYHVSHNTKSYHLKEAKILASTTNVGKAVEDSGSYSR